MSRRSQFSLAVVSGLEAKKLLQIRAHTLLADGMLASFANLKISNVQWGYGSLALPRRCTQARVYSGKLRHNKLLLALIRALALDLASCYHDPIKANLQGKPIRLRVGALGSEGGPPGNHQVSSFDMAQILAGVSGMCSNLL